MENQVVQIEGSLDRVTFRGEDGFVIGVLFCGGKERPKIKGSLPEGMREGDHLRLSGEWFDDKKWGKQFNFSAAEVVIPSTTDGIAKWLQTHIDGIGARGAAILVEKFGVDAPKILEPRTDTAGDPLVELLELAPEKVIAARASYAALSTHPEQSLWLAEKGFVGARAGKLVRKYKGETRTVLEADPFTPMRELDGWGFKTCDELAKKLGLADHDPRRVGAAIVHSFDLQADNGHVYLIEDDLLNFLAREFYVPIDSSREELKRLVREGELVLEGVESPRYLLPALQRAENDICFDLLRLLKATEDLPPIEAPPDPRLNAEQAAARDLVARAGVVIVTGGPGTGKSFTLDAMLDVVAPDRMGVQLCAPTGKAAKRMTQATRLEAKTIHRALEYAPPSGGQKGGFSRGRSNPLEANVVVVDEASMMDTALAASLFRAVRTGARLIIVGDVDQLPSVGAGMVLRDIIDSGLVPVVRLVKNMRSAEGGAVANAALKIVAGERLDDEDLAGEVRFLEVENAETAAAEIVRLLSGGEGGIPGVGISDVQVLCPKRVNALGAIKLNAAIQAAVNPPGPDGELEVEGVAFRVGDKVIVGKNDYDLEVFNGDTGRVVKLDVAKKKLRVDLDDGRSIVFAGRDHLRLLSLAYAISVHRSQGSEYPIVVMPVHSSDGRMLYRNLLYTGLTRAKKRVYMVGDRKALNRAVKYEAPSERNTSLCARLIHLANRPKKEEP